MKNGDLPASPAPAELYKLWEDPRYTSRGVIDNLGLTKREEFAKAAMQGLIIISDTLGENPDVIAELAIEQADALLEALDK